MKNTTDYSDELSDLKQLHEENIGRKFSDEEFNQIFEVAQKSTSNLFKIADRFQSDMMGLLMTLDEATREWEEKRLVSNAKGNPKEEIKNMIADLGKVIDYYANDKNPNWGTVGTLSNIHESLGKQLYETYDKHTGYSKSVEEGMKRHSESAKELLLQANDEVKNLDSKKHLPDLIRWRNFFKDLLEGFLGILPKLQTKSALQKDEKFYHHTMMAGYYEIQEKKLSDTIIDLKSSSDSDLHKAAETLEKQREKMAEKAAFHHGKKKELFNEKIHGHWNDTIPRKEEARIYGEKFLKSTPEKSQPTKAPSLKEEAIELAKKIGTMNWRNILKQHP